MKKFILFIALLYYLFEAKAQTQITTPAPTSHILSYSQSLILTPTTSTYYIVPTGTVWKITSANFSGIPTGTTELLGNGYYPMISITPPGGSAKTVYFSAFATGSSGSVFDGYTAFPMWMPAGTRITLPASGGTSATPILYAIEFMVN